MLVAADGLGRAHASHQAGVLGAASLRGVDRVRMSTKLNYPGCSVATAGY